MKGKFIAFIVTLVSAVASSFAYGYFIFQDIEHITSIVGRDTAEFLFESYFLLECGVVFAVVGFRIGVITLKKFSDEEAVREFVYGSIGFVLHQQVVCFAGVLVARAYIAYEAGFGVGSILSLILVVGLLFEIKKNYRLHNRFQNHGENLDVN